MSLFNKALSIVPGDIVSVTAGRGWRRARVLKRLADNELLIKFRDGRRTKVSADHVLTEDEQKSFKRAKGQTSVIRKGSDFDGSNDSQDVDSEDFSQVQDQEENAEIERGSKFRKLF